MNFTGLVIVPKDRQPEARVRIRNSYSSMHISEGWIYLFGSQPNGTTDLVNVVATGTTLILHDEGNTSTVIFLCADGDEQVVVTATGTVAERTSNQRIMENPSTYLEITLENGITVFGEVKPIPPRNADPDQIWEIIDSTRDAVQAAGTGGWCDPVVQ